MDQGVAFIIEGWEIHPDACALRKNETAVHLEPKVMDLLVFMAQSPEQVFSREELLEEIWPNVIVSDEALTNAIIKLRKALKDSARNPRIIETVPKRGYRLIAKVQNVIVEQTQSVQDVTSITAPEAQPASLTEAAPRQGKKYWLAATTLVTVLLVIAAYMLIEPDFAQPAESTPAMVKPEQPSIAVLPFINIGNEINDTYFSDGITDDLITDLAGLSGLFVISRNSTFQYKGRAVDAREVAAALGVKFVLEGSVRRSGERMRVNTQLIDGVSGGQVWAERYEGSLEDVFSLQDRMTEKIVAALAVELTDREKGQLYKSDTLNPRAYDEYLRGMQLRWRVNRDSYALAEQHFKKALELDPGYTRAHTALALLYMKIWQQGWHQNSGSQAAGWSKARQHLEAASGSPDALMHSLRSIMQLHNRRFDNAVAEARQAVTLNPGSADGYLVLAEALSYTGRSTEAIEYAKEAQRRDPNFPAPYLLVEGRSLFDLKRYNEAIETLQRASFANPADTAPMIFRIASLGHLGESDQARAVLEQLNSKLKNDRLPAFTLSTLRNRLPYKDREALAHLKDGLLKGGVPEW